MCGIVGLVGLEDELLIKRMVKTISHRGPDAEGIFIGDNISLGHVRLSIIDAHERSNQPFLLDNTVAVYNGEVYNFNRLKKGLSGEFKTKSDTEVIVKYFNEQNRIEPSQLLHFNGMFTLALLRNRKLYLMRDTVGIKPLYYHIENKLNVVSFASEIKALLSLPWIEPSLNTKFLHHYFQYRYFPVGITGFKNIYEVLPGEVISIDPKSPLNYESEVLDHAKYHHNNNFYSSNELWKFIRQIRAEITHSVKESLISDIPIGIFLSGGLDSSIIALIASKYANNSINTISVAFDHDYNENYFGSIIANEISSNHHILFVDEEIKPELTNKIFWHLEEPTVDAAVIPNYLMAKKASSLVNVVLSGDGSDELFAGYHRYWLINLLKKWRIKKFSNLIGTLNDILLRRYDSIFLRSMAAYGKSSDQEMNLSINRLFSNSEILNLKSNLLLNYENMNNANLPKHLVSFLIKRNKLTYENMINIYDFENLMVKDFLLRIDKLSMASSIEVRVPFLNRNVVNTSFKIPFNYLINNGERKIFLKKAFKDIIPQEIFSRKKRGFDAPAHNWLQYSLKDDFDNLFDCSPFSKDDKIRRIKNSIREIPSKHYNREFFKLQKVWGLYTFLKWHNIFFNSASQ